MKKKKNLRSNDGEHFLGGSGGSGGRGGDVAAFKKTKGKMK
jgi:hypothetical protein